MDAYPPSAFYFRVSFGPSTAPEDASFQEVGGIGPEMEVESFREGGENRFVHSLPKGVKHPKLTLKRGVANRDSPLVAWCQSVLQGGLAERIKPQLVLIHLLDAEAKPLRSWSFENAYPTHWTVDEFRADKNAVAIEKIELNYAVSTRKL
ncbi:phage tail protein [Phenylobacterium sp.]|uniref:phage tail protein n=1 Tax=Phenylobacterium sp. TaxID=1871053 RepID=UPI0025EE7E72|nr:phage tail protein [Phenylobacterium sp.]